MCRLINVLELLCSFSFNNPVSLTRHLTITLLKSFFVEIGNIISHYNHLMHLFPSTLLLLVPKLLPNPVSSSFSWKYISLVDSETGLFAM